MQATMERPPKKQELEDILGGTRVFPCPICKHSVSHIVRETLPPDPYRYEWFCPQCEKVCGHIIPPFPPSPIPLENLAWEDLLQLRDDVKDAIEKRKGRAYPR